MPEAGPRSPRRRRSWVTAAQDCWPAWHLLVLLAGALVLGACGSIQAVRHVPGPPASSSSTLSRQAPVPGPGPGRPCADGAPPARYSHVVWIWMENHTWGSVIGNPSAPYITAMAHQCGTDANFGSENGGSSPPPRARESPGQKG